MRRWGAATVVMTAAVAVVVRGQGSAGLALWEVVVLAALLVVSWRGRAPSPGAAPALFGGAVQFERRPPGRLASLELEVVGATDRRLRGGVGLRRRLIGLAEHRAGVKPGSLSLPGGRAVLGILAWETLTEREGVLTTAEVEMLVSRIEAL